MSNLTEPLFSQDFLTLKHHFGTLHTVSEISYFFCYGPRVGVEGSVVARLVF